MIPLAPSLWPVMMYQVFVSASLVLEETNVTAAYQVSMDLAAVAVLVRVIVDVTYCWLEMAVTLCSLWMRSKWINQCRM